VIHGMHDEQDMRKMGRLAKFMPVTCATFIVGWLAIAGVPPFAGFWSKDEILLFAAADSWALYVVVFATALLTALYMTRQVIMTFFGEARWETEAEAHSAHGEFKPHESPPIMFVPLLVLAGLAIVGGAMQLPSLGIIPDEWEHKLEDWLHPVVEFGEAEIGGTWADEHLVLLLLLAVACSLAGIVLAWLIYQRKRIRAVEPELFAQGWYYDRAVSWFMGNPGRTGFEVAAAFDADVVDGAVNGTATVVRETANEVRKGQTGYVRQYASVIGLGVVLLLAWFVVVRGIL
jgi:NADH-quinone oxidoreductase subunit L